MPSCWGRLFGTKDKMEFENVPASTPHKKAKQVAPLPPVRRSSSSSDKQVASHKGPELIIEIVERQSEAVVDSKPQVAEQPKEAVKQPEEIVKQPKDAVKQPEVAVKQPKEAIKQPAAPMKDEQLHETIEQLSIKEQPKNVTINPETTIIPDEAQPVKQGANVPPWVTNEFLSQSLRNKLGRDVTVTNYDVTSAVALGENYACNVFRAVVSTADGERHQLILKCLPENPIRSKFALQLHVTVKEIRMYTNTLPLLRGTLATPHTPACYHVIQDGVRDTLVFDDLGVYGFRTRNRQLGLDLAHTRLAIIELAHLHGLSAALKRTDPETFDREVRLAYPETFYTMDNAEAFVAMVNTSVVGVAQAVKAHLPRRFHSIADLMTKMAPHAFHMVVEQVRSEGLKILNHGDFWNNNFLFRYSPNCNVPLECSLIDFQLSRYASPVLDLLYFLYGSTEQHFRREHLNEMFELYFNEVLWTLKKRGISEPDGIFYQSMEALRSDVRRHALFGFVSAVLVMPVVVAESKDVPDVESITGDLMETMTGDDNPFLKMFSGPIFYRRMKQIIEDFDDQGLFQEIETLLDREYLK